MQPYDQWIFWMAGSKYSLRGKFVSVSTHDWAKLWICMLTIPTFDRTKQRQRYDIIWSWIIIMILSNHQAYDMTETAFTFPNGRVMRAQKMDPSLPVCVSLALQGSPPNTTNVSNRCLHPPCQPYTGKESSCSSPYISELDSVPSHLALHVSFRWNMCCNHYHCILPCVMDWSALACNDSKDNFFRNSWARTEKRKQLVDSCPGAEKKSSIHCNINHGTTVLNKEYKDEWRS